MLEAVQGIFLSGRMLHLMCKIHSMSLRQRIPALGEDLEHKYSWEKD